MYRYSLAAMCSLGRFSSGDARFSRRILHLKCALLEFSVSTFYHKAQLGKFVVGTIATLNTIYPIGSFETLLYIKAISCSLEQIYKTDYLDVFWLKYSFQIILLCMYTTGVKLYENGSLVERCEVWDNACVKGVGQCCQTLIKILIRFQVLLFSEQGIKLYALNWKATWGMLKGY